MCRLMPCSFCMFFVTLIWMDTLLEESLLNVLDVQQWIHYAHVLFYFCLKMKTLQLQNTAVKVSHGIYYKSL
jgi:hypothetical protein